MRCTIIYCVLSAGWAAALSTSDDGGLSSIRQRNTNEYPRLSRRGPGNKIGDKSGQQQQGASNRVQSTDPRRLPNQSIPPNQSRPGPSRPDIIRTFSGLSASSSFASAKGNKNPLDTASSLVSATGYGRSPTDLLATSASEFSKTGSMGSLMSTQRSISSFTSARDRPPPQAKVGPVATQQGHPETQKPQSPKSGAPLSPTASSSASSLTFNPQSPQAESTSKSSAGSRSSSHSSEISIPVSSPSDIPAMKLVPGKTRSRETTPSLNILSSNPWQKDKKVNDDRERSQLPVSTHPSSVFFSTGSSLSMSGPRFSPSPPRGRSPTPSRRLERNSPSWSTESLSVSPPPSRSRRVQAPVTPPEISPDVLQSKFATSSTLSIPDPPQIPANQRLPHTPGSNTSSTQKSQRSGSKTPSSPIPQSSRSASRNNSLQPSKPGIPQKQRSQVSGSITPSSLEPQVSSSVPSSIGEPRKYVGYTPGTKQITVQSAEGNKAVVKVPPGQIARVTVPNPSERKKATQIILADLPPGTNPFSPAIARQNNPGGFASNCALTAAGCLTVASAAMKESGSIDRLQAGAGASMIAAGTLGMTNSFGIDRKATDFGKKCIGAACKGIQGLMSKKTSSVESESPRTPQSQAATQGSFAASVDDLPVRRK